MCGSLFTLASVLAISYGKTESLRIILVKLERVITPRFCVKLKSLLWSVLTETDIPPLNLAGKCRSSYGTNRSLVFVTIDFIASWWFYCFVSFPTLLPHTDTCVLAPSSSFSVCKMLTVCSCSQWGHKLEEFWY